MIILMGLMTTEAYNFYVWGGGGWALNPSENFNHWAERNRFQVNDSLVFKNKKGSRRLCFDCEERRLVRRATGWIAECRWLLQFFVIVHFEKLVKELEPADNVGPALQFLKFCSAFRKVLSMILDQSVHPDVLNHHKHTPLMLAAMHGKICCVWKLLQAGAIILMFDSMHGRSFLRYAAYYKY
ncbi:uncharacterized protein LOC143858006 isoform X2 [Tasmannia lanceolata]|uniref:uncharacterized protein LOC143858006 isoform X2 n=1 Tax=Tasmannia lanceolata TaxID=3420 RepID=UPI004063E05A